MSGRVRLSHRARRDIEEVVAWTHERFGLRQARRYAGLLRRALEEIGRNPRNRRAVNREGLAADILVYHIGRRGSLGRHLFVYRVGRDGSAEVARLLHDSMDVGRHVNE